MYTAGHKLRSKTRIPGNFNTERLQYIMGLFTWREEDPSTRKILEGGITLRWVYMQKFRPVSWLCIKGGRGHREVCVGTWDLGTRDEGLEDIKYGTQGRQIKGRRERGM